MEKQLLLVANAHMHWDPEYSDVKLVQTMMFLSEVKNIVDKATRSLKLSSVSGETNAIPLVLCADLNSLPDSGMYASTRAFRDLIFLLAQFLMQIFLHTQVWWSTWAQVVWTAPTRTSKSYDTLTAWPTSTATARTAPPAPGSRTASSWRVPMRTAWCLTPTTPLTLRFVLAVFHFSKTVKG